MDDPQSYGAWFETPLGRRVWEDERSVIRDLVGGLHDQCILDAGAGDGRLAVELVSGGALVTGVDASEAMLHAAQTRAAAAGTSLPLVVGRLEALPFRSAVFDRVVAVTVLCFVEDPRSAMREMARVTRPGGSVVVGELGRWSLWAFIRRLRSIARGGVWARARFWTRRGLEALLKDAGLQVSRRASAVFYPPVAILARVAAPLDRTLGRYTSLGAAFLALAAEKREG